MAAVITCQILPVTLFWFRQSYCKKLCNSFFFFPRVEIIINSQRICFVSVERKAIICGCEYNKRRMLCCTQLILSKY